MSMIHTFSGNPFDRGDNERRDPAWLEDSQGDKASLFLPFWQLSVLVRHDPDLELGWLNGDRLPPNRDGNNRLSEPLIPTSGTGDSGLGLHQDGRITGSTTSGRFGWLVIGVAPCET